MARERIARTGVAPGGKLIWTARERALLAVIFPDYRRAIIALRRRSYSAVKYQARAMGLTDIRHVWTAAEVARLRRVFRTASTEALAAAFPGIPVRKIYKKANHVGLYRERQPFKRTGFMALDQIRDRAFELNLSMVDLDAMAGTRTYFQKAGWTGRTKLNYRAIGRAAEALDGLVAVRWMEAG